MSDDFEVDPVNLEEVRRLREVVYSAVHAAMEHEPIAADQIELLNRYASSPADPAALVAPGAVGTNVETVSKPPLIALDCAGRSRRQLLGCRRRC